MRHLLEGQAPLTDAVAHDLERVLGVPAHFWLTREAQYRAQCARLDMGRTPAHN
jgi:HTH-type transcriptional regulator/antitoxin HigA